MSIVHAIVPVAGRGTRMLPLAKSLPKEMLPVARRPVVQHVVQELERNDFRSILLVNSIGKDAIKDHFDLDTDLMNHLRESGKTDLLRDLDFLHRETQIFSTRQREQRGLGDAILHGEAFTRNEPFAVALGDSILGRFGQSRVLSQMREVFETQKCAAVVAFSEVEADEVHRYGIAAPLGNVDGSTFELRDLVEKPAPHEAPSRLAIAGRYLFSPALYGSLRETKPGKDGEIQLTDAMRGLLQNGERILGIVLPPDEQRFDIGNFPSYFKAFVEFALYDPVYGEALREHARKLLMSEEED